VRVQFSLPYATAWGESIGVTGSVPALGQWNALQALRLTWQAGNIWEGEVRLRPTDVDYKFVVLDDASRTVKRWEGGENRRITQAQLNQATGERFRTMALWEA